MECLTVIPLAYLSAGHPREPWVAAGLEAEADAVARWQGRFNVERVISG